MSFPKQTAFRLLEMLQAGRIQQVIQDGERLAKKYPKISGLMEVVGIAHARAKNLPRAEMFLKRALKLNSKSPQAHVNLGNVLLEGGSFALAINHYNAALKLDNSIDLARFNLALAQFQIGEHALAEEGFNGLLDRSFNSADAYFYLALIARARDDNDLAKNRLEAAIGIRPKHFQSHFNLGNVCRDLFQSHEALDAYKKAIELKQEHIPTLINMAHAYLQLQKPDQAMAKLNDALSLDPKDADAQLTRSLVSFLSGDLKKGFEFAEARFGGTDPIRPLYVGKEPTWTGDALPKDTTLVVYAEQGLGDTIMMLRFLPMLETAVRDCIVILQEELITLAQHSFPEWQFASIKRHRSGWKSETARPLQKISLMSLPHILNEKWDRPPTPTPYVKASEPHLGKWKKHFKEHDSIRIGLVWRGNPNHWNDHNRSLTLPQLMEQLPVGPTYVVLQKDISPDEREWLNNHHPHSVLAPDIRDFGDTAALCSDAALVVSVDTSVAHLAAAMDVPTAILLPKLPDWRWQLNGTSSKWYPSVTLHRQIEAGDWQPPLQTVAGHIEALL